LRGHPLSDDEHIAGAAFAPRLVHATVEHRVFRAAGPFRLGGALFLDAVHVSGARAAGGRGFLDAGVGAFAAAGSREVMLSLAGGGSGWVLSLRSSHTNLWH
jgi:hypothetical protein